MEKPENSNSVIIKKRVDFNQSGDNNNNYLVMESVDVPTALGIVFLSQKIEESKFEKNQILAIRETSGDDKTILSVIECNYSLEENDSKYSSKSINPLEKNPKKSKKSKIISQSTINNNYHPDSLLNH